MRSFLAASLHPMANANAQPATSANNFDRKGAPDIADECDMAGRILVHLYAPHRTTRILRVS